MPRGIFERTKAIREKMRLAKLGKKRKPLSKEWKEKIKKGLIGNKNSLGTNPSKETREKMGAYWKGRKRPKQQGENHLEEKRK